MENKNKFEKIGEAFRNRFSMRTKKQAAESFAEKRATKEGFDKSDHSIGYIDNLPVEFLTTLYTGYVKNKFYSKKEDTLRESLPIHKAMFEKNPKFYLNALKRARNSAAIKDQVIIGSLIAGDATLIKDMPPTQIQKLWKWGFKSSRSKKLIKKYLEAVAFFGKMQFYIAKYPSAMKMLVNSSHYLIPKEDYHFMMHTTTKTSNVILYSDVAKVKKNHSLEGIESDVIPFEVARSAIPSSMWKKENLLEHTDINPYAMLSQASSLADIFGEAKIAGMLSKAKYITSDKFLTAAFANDEKHPLLTQALAEMYTDSVSDTYKKMTLPFELKKLIVVMDISGSMESYIQKMLATIAPFAPVIDELIYFGSHVEIKDPEDLMTFEGLKKLNYTAGATNLAEAVYEAEKLATKQNSVIIMTDEQGNIGNQEINAIRNMRKKGIEVIVVNPTDYKNHMLLNDVVYVPATTPESFAATIRYTQLRHVTQKEIDLLGESEKQGYGQNDELGDEVE